MLKGLCHGDLLTSRGTDIILIIFVERNQATAINVDFLKTMKQFENASLTFSEIAIRFHPRHPQPIMLVNSFSALI